ncbi:MAG: hypothetical protein ABI150_13220 [Nitrobacter sp.]
MFAREFEKVAMESARDSADYPRYLLRLCELERIEREETYNINAEPFVWTKSKVQERRVKGRRLRDL